MVQCSEALSELFSPRELLDELSKDDKLEQVLEMILDELVELTDWREELGVLAGGRSCCELVVSSTTLLVWLACHPGCT